MSLLTTLRSRWAGLTVGERLALCSLTVAVLGFSLNALASGPLQKAFGAAWAFISPPPKPVIVSSMNFPEQVVLGEIISQLLEKRGVSVTRTFRQDGDRLRHAIETGNIDCYVDYSSAPYTLVFNQRPIADEEAVYNYIKSRYADRKIVVSKEFNYQNEWWILMRPQDAAARKIETLSDLSQHAEGLRAGFLPDYNTDHVGGKVPLKGAYNLRFAQESELAMPYIYEALHKGEVDVISGNSTDSEVQQYGLKALADDKHFFAPYYPVILARGETLDRCPALREVVEKLPEKMTVEEIRLMNSRVRAEPDKLSEIAREWIAASW
ncbi:MAG TPA: glycine betaine ABC transporter substrate-binding protein [Pyrinomonadaceae bacterium]|nr:glycine betaine ABC transporter substrate-binding protein [Pyrinomonadaceae bacterium]